MVNIHSTAFIHPNAIIGDEVKVGPFCTVGPNVCLERGVELRSHVVVDGYTTVGEDSVIYPFASIGTEPQDLKYRGERTYVKIGKKCQIREYVTINSSCGLDSAVTIGDSCLLMAGVHIAHNCTVGQQAILANNVLLAGHVEVGDFAIIGGLTALHQHTKIGPYAFCGGMSRCDGDLLPFLIGGGADFRIGGLNLVGLKRRGFDLERRIKLTKLFKIVYRQAEQLEEAIKEISDNFNVEDLDVALWLKACQTSKRGLAGYKNRKKTKLVNSVIY